MKIVIETIEHKDQRYPTCGDWWIDTDGTWQIRVSKLNDWRYEFLIAFHELIEMAWCEWKKIPELDVAAFDQAYESRRTPGDVSEPGDAEDAPYYWGHQIATTIERAAALALGVNWQEYSRSVENL